MKLVIVIPYYEPAWAYGGPPRLLSNIARQLAKCHSVTVLTTDVLDAHNRVKPAYEELGGVKVYRFSTVSNTLSSKTKIIIPRHYRQQLAAALRSADLVWLSDFRHWLNAASASILWQYRIPYVLAAWGQIQKPHDFKYPLKVVFDWMWGKALIQRANMLIAQTDHEAKDYITLGARPEQMHLMPLMETRPTADELAQRGKFRAQHNISDTVKLLLFIGRLNKLKGIDVLVNSFAQVRQRLPQHDIRLVIVGRDDGYAAALQRHITQLGLTQQVIQTGPLYGADNAAVYLAADYFVFTPTYYEETSLATVRALSFGLPVLTTVQAELPWLDEYEAGYTLRNQTGLIVDKLTQAVPDAILRSKLSSNAQRLFTERYERDQVITQLEHGFKHILQSLPQ